MAARVWCSIVWRRVKFPPSAAATNQYQRVRLGHCLGDHLQHTRLFAGVRPDRTLNPLILCEASGQVPCL